MLRYAGVFIGAAVLVLLGIGGWKGWQWHQHRRNIAAATQYVALTDRIDQQKSGLTKAGEVKDAKALTSFADKAPPGYATLARLRAAALYDQAGDTRTALSLWTRIGTKGSGANTLLGGLANLLWAQHEMGIAPDDSVIARLKPLAAPSNPWHDMAQFNLAVLDMKAGKTAQAKPLLDQVSADPQAPANLRNLAEGLIAKLNG